MASRPFALLIAAALVASCILPAWAEPSGPQIADYTLDNGLELVVIPDHRAPVVTHMVWYKIGAADEKPGKSGIAHFLEHLMFKGTTDHPAGEFSALVARLGGEENAFTSNDYTGYYQRVPTEALPKVMAFEADRMTNLVLTDEVVLPERQVILEERNQRIDNDPRAQLGVQMDAALYLNSPYHKPVIGWRHEMEGLTRADAIAFYQRYYGPNNAVVVIAGDVDPERALELAKQTYGKVARRTDLPPRRRPTEPPQIAARTVTLADPRVELPSVDRAYLVPSFPTAQPGESAALEVLAHVLGSGNSSRLYRELVVDKKLAVSAGAWYDSAALEMTKFDVFAAPRPDVTLPQVEQAIDATIAELIDKGVTKEELERSKTRLIADAIYAHDSQASMARWYGTALMTGATVSDVNHWTDRIRAVNAEAVQDAARKWLDKRHSVTGYLIKQKGPQVEKRS